jgi:hypothetical protein
MTLAELISAFRARADDATEPYLWSDDEVILILNEAQVEAATRAKLIRDATTPAVTEIAVTSTDVDSPLHAAILSVEYAKLASQPKPLTRTTVEELDENYPDWRAMVGQPKFYVEDNSRIRLVPQSPMDDTLSLTVFRLPLTAMATDTDTPEIHPKYHYRMLDWALRCAYLKQDAETLDKAKAGEYQALFEQSFGVLPDANVQRKQRRHKPSIVRMYW